MSDTTTIISKRFKIRYNPEINLGHVLMIVSFIIPALIYGVAFAADFRIMKSDVEQLKKQASQLIENQNMALRSYEVVATRLADHIEAEKMRRNSAPRNQ